MGAIKTDPAVRQVGNAPSHCLWLVCGCLLFQVFSANSQALWKTARIVYESQSEWTAAQAWEHSLSGEVRYLNHAHETLDIRQANTLWVAWSLPISITQQLPLWMGLHLPACAYAQLWMRSDRGDWQLQALEREQSSARWGQGHMSPVWVLPQTAEGNIDVLLRIPNTGRMQLPVWLNKHENFMRIQGKYALMHGVLLVLLIAMVVYASSLSRFFAKQDVLYFTGMLLAQLTAMACLSGMLQLLCPGVPLPAVMYLQEIAIWTWLLLGAFHTHRVICYEHTQPLPRQTLLCWSLAACVFGPLWSLSCPTRANDIAAGVLLVHVLMMLAYCAWYTKQKISLNKACQLMAWLIYGIAILCYMWSDVFDLEPQQGILLSSGWGVIASILMVWAYGWRLVIQYVNLQRKLNFEIQRNHWYALAHHDLWQPLQSVQLYAHAMAQAPPDQLPRLLSGIHLATRSVEDFMQQLRCFSSPQQTPFDWLSHRETVTAHGLLSPLITECLPLAHCRHVSLRYRSNRCVLRVNVSGVQRMLRNLINNALTYTPPGGSVLIGCRLHGDRLWILCMDNGKGMTPQQLQQCTQAYQRFETNNVFDLHQGLGLYSVKRMAEQMQLPLRLQSRLGKGSTFGIAVPVVHTQREVVNPD